jgi:hypothetical protein
MGKAKHGLSKAAALGVIMALAFAMQSLLATWTAMRSDAAPSHPHHSHHVAHHSHDSADNPAQPAPEPVDHHKLCCILGSKLGTAIGPAPEPVLLPVPTGELVAEIAQAWTRIPVIVRLPLPPLGARAPPLLI